MLDSHRFVARITFAFPEVSSQRPVAALARAASRTPPDEQLARLADCFPGLFLEIPSALVDLVRAGQEHQNVAVLIETIDFEHVVNNYFEIETVLHSLVCELIFKSCSSEQNHRCLNHT